MHFDDVGLIQVREFTCWLGRVEHISIGGGNSLCPLGVKFNYSDT